MTTPPDVPGEDPAHAAGADDAPPGDVLPPERSALATARELLAAARASARAAQRSAPPIRSGGRTCDGGRAAPPGSTGAAPDDRDPQLLDATIGGLLAERGWETEAAVARVLGDWPALVGPDIAAHSRPDSFSCGDSGGGVLVIAADSTAWATQLRLLAPQLLARLAQELGPDVVSRVRVRGPAAPSWRKGPRSVRGRGPRDTYG